MWSVNFPNSWEEVQTWDLKTHLNSLVALTEWCDWKESRGCYFGMCVQPTTGTNIWFTLSTYFLPDIDETDTSSDNLESEHSPDGR